MADLVPEGLHHVTCVCQDWEPTRDFYDQLGFDLVKNTVNHDAPETRHTYHGDARGSPGTVITFFEWPSEGRAQPGLQSAHHVAVTLPDGISLDDAAARAEELAASPPELLEDEGCLEVADPDGLTLRLFESEAEGPRLAWVGLYGAVRERVSFYRETIGFEVDEETTPATVQAPDGSTVLKLLPGEPGPGRVRPGGVHHFAFLTDEETQGAVGERLTRAGGSVNGPIDRHYFQSLYSRDPGRHVIEFATPGPGFTVDEEADALGTTLVLPPWLEDRRDSIEAALGET